MKRIVISIVIIAAIISAGCLAIGYIGEENEIIYGKIEEVLNAEGDAATKEAVRELERAFEKYENRLSCIVDEDILEEMSAAVSMLMPMYEASSDEFTAQCELVKAYAKRLLDREIPTLPRVM